MPYWGKVVGAVAGLATGRPWIALIGLVLGHQFDRGFADKFRKFGSNTPNSRLEQLPDQFVKILFQTVGHIAKADGRVTEEEIRAARGLMHRLGLGPVEVREAMTWFESGKEMSFPLRSTIRDLRVNAARKSESRSLFVRLLLEVALSKPALHQRERVMLWVVCADARRVAAAYRTLGIEKTQTNAEIKKAYRRLMNRNHPDKIASDNPDAAVIAEAERRTREVRSAYEMLKSRRSIR
jgi:DnaJ like chaperone protein